MAGRTRRPRPRRSLRTLPADRTSRPGDASAAARGTDAAPRSIARRGPGRRHHSSVYHKHQSNSHYHCCYYSYCQCHLTRSARQRRSHPERRPAHCAPPIEAGCAVAAGAPRAAVPGAGAGLRGAGARTAQGRCRPVWRCLWHVGARKKTTRRRRMLRMVVTGWCPVAGVAVARILARGSAAGHRSTRTGGAGKTTPVPPPRPPPRPPTSPLPATEGTWSTRTCGGTPADTLGSRTAAACPLRYTQSTGRLLR